MNNMKLYVLLYAAIQSAISKNKKIGKNFKLNQFNLFYRKRSSQQSKTHSATNKLV